jgi:hypothetical protein
VRPGLSLTPRGIEGLNRVRRAGQSGICVAEQNQEPGIVRIALEHSPGAIHAFLGATEGDEPCDGFDLNVPIAGAEISRRDELLSGFLVLMQLFEDSCQLYPSLAILRVQPDGLAVLPRGLVELMLRDEFIAVPKRVGFELGFVGGGTSGSDRARQRDGANDRSYTFDHDQDC